MDNITKNVSLGKSIRYSQNLNFSPAYIVTVMFSHQYDRWF